MTQIPIITETIVQPTFFLQKQNELKKLRKKIRKLKRQRNQQIEEMKKNLILKYIPINKKAQRIIEGLDQVLIDEKKVSCHASELEKSKCLCNAKTNSSIQIGDDENEEISDYWKKVLMGSHGEALKKHDLDLLKYLNEISVKEYSRRKIVLIFGIRPGHPFIMSGNYERSIIFNEERNPIFYNGQIVPNSHKLKSGLMKLILTTTSNPQNLIAIKQFFDLAAIQIIPKSLNYYLSTRFRQSPQIGEMLNIRHEFEQQRNQTFYESIYTRCDTN